MPGFKASFVILSICLMMNIYSCDAVRGPPDRVIPGSRSPRQNRQLKGFISRSNSQQNIPSIPTGGTLHGFQSSTAQQAATTQSSAAATAQVNNRFAGFEEYYFRLNRYPDQTKNVTASRLGQNLKGNVTKSATGVPSSRCNPLC